MRAHLLAIGFFLAMSTAPAPAHHSFAPHFDPNRIVTITGTVTEFQYRNPHSFVRIAVTNEAGTTEEWTCESHAASLLSRQGFSRDLFAVGEEYTITGSASRRSATGCRVYTRTGRDGNRVALFDGGIPEILEQSAPENRSIFADWLPMVLATTLREDRIGNSSTGPNPFEEQLTAAGRAAHAAYDQVTDDPTLVCDPSSPWRAWAGSPGSPARLQLLDDRVEIRYEWMDVTREIRLDVDTHPAGVMPSPLGHSIGRLDGDSLVVETIAMSSGILIPHPGILMSPDARLTERISLLGDSGELRIAWQLDDPTFYTSPPVGDFTMEASSVDFERFNCVPNHD